MRTLVAAVLVCLAGACASGIPGPVPLDTRNDACAECRMAVSSARFASQLVAPGEEPRFFDDLGCLAAHLRDRSGLPPGAVAYVADHRTSEWVGASSAVFTRVAGLETPMGSHVIAHASAGSRDADPAAHGGEAVDAAAFFGGPLPGGARWPR
jgi:copper chaperone NosL